MIFTTVDKEDLVFTANARGFGERNIEVLRINGMTGTPKFSKPIQLADENRISVAIGAKVANAIDLACQAVDADGAGLPGVREILIRTLAVTDAQGTLSAATAPVGTLIKVPAILAGEKLAWMSTRAADGRFSFKVTDTAAEVCLVIIQGTGLMTRTLRLTFV